MTGGKHKVSRSRVHFGRSFHASFFPDAEESDAELFVETHRSVETMAEFQVLLLRLEQDCTKLDELVAKV
jgi:hypothetical protein